MRAPDFYLASTESYMLEKPRRSWRIKRLESPGRKDLLLVKIDPPLPGEKCGLQGRDIELVLVATRHTDGALFPIRKWPVYVHVALPLVGDEELELRDMLREDEFKSMAWAELYQTEEDARLKVT